MATNRNWLKRLFRLDFDDQFDAALDLIEVQEIAIVDVHDRVDGVQEAVKVCAAVPRAVRAPRSFSRSLLLLTLSLHCCGAVPRGVLIHLARVVR